MQFKINEIFSIINFTKKRENEGSVFRMDKSGQLWR
jgi:hypothetical protein